MDYGIAGSSNHLGTIYRNIGDLNKAVEYHKLALKYGEKHLTRVFKGYIFNHLAEINRMQGEYISAIFILRRDNFMEDQKAIKAIGQGYITFGNIYRDKKDYDIAYKYYESAKGLLDEQ